LIGGLPSAVVHVPEQIQRQIVSLAEFVGRARTHVARDYQKQIVDVPEPESATRLGQQLYQLVRGLARLGHRTTVSQHDMDDMRRAALDCIPLARQHALGICRGRYLEATARSTRKYALDDLRELELIERGGDRPSTLGERLLREGGVRHVGH
jgi:hypothetical protein